MWKSAKAFQESIMNTIESLSIDKIVLVLSILLYLLLMVPIIQFSIFSWYSIIFLHFLPLLLMFYIYKRLEKIHSIGVINYLPSSIKDFFLAQSVFDVLCNIWFVPKLSLYVKRFALPFFVNMSREDAYSLIYELDPGLALKLDTKGVINILPEKVSKAILPKNKNFDKLSRNTNPGTQHS